MSVKSSQKKTTFSNKYSSDIFFHNMYYAALVRSNKKNGIIRSVTLPTLPEGYSYFGAKHIPGKKTINVEGVEIPIFAENYVHYEGEPIGIIIGPDESKVCYLRDNTEVDIENLPYTSFDINNTHLIIAKREIIHGNPEIEIDDTFISESTSTIEHQTTISDTQSVIVKSFKKCEIFFSTYLNKNLQDEIEKVLAVPKESIVYHKTLTNSESINVMWELAVLACQVAVASMLSKEAIKLTLTHAEQKKYCQNHTSPVIEHQTLVSHDGKIHTMKISVFCDAGSYSPHIQKMLDRIAIAACGAYTPENIHIQTYALKTNNPPTDFTFDFADSIAFFGVETQIRAILAQTDSDPVNLRKINIFSQKHRENFFCYHDVSQLERLIDEAVTKSDFMRKFMSFKMIASKRGKNYFPTRGIGSAVGYNGLAYFNTSDIRNKISLDAILNENKTLTLFMLEPPVQIKNVLYNIIKNILKIQKENVIFELKSSKDIITDADYIVSHTSASIFLTEKICRVLNDKLKDSKLPIVITEKIPTTKKKWDKKEFLGMPYASTSWGMAIAEVETDTSLYIAKVDTLFLYIDAGTINNETLAISRVKHSVHRVLRSLGLHNTDKTDVRIFFTKSSGDFKDFSGLCENIIPAAVFNALSQAVGKNITTVPLNSQLMYTSSE